MKFDVTDLPSRGIPYAVKTIDVQPFRPRHMPFLSEALMTDNLAPLIEAVDQVIDFDVYQLTDGDFYYILTWLRFNSRDIPMYAPWECTGTMFRRKDTGEILNILKIDELVEQWEKAKGTEAAETMVDPMTLEFDDLECGNKCKEIVTFADFKTLQMSEVPLDPRLDYPRVATMVEFNELVKDKRYTKIIGPTRYIKDGFNIHAKLEIVDSLQDMELFDVASRAHFEYEHGIMQDVRKRCPQCGSSHDFVVTIGADSFFVV